MSRKTISTSAPTRERGAPQPTLARASQLESGELDHVAGGAAISTPPVRTFVCPADHNT